MTFIDARKHFLVKHYRWAQNFLVTELRHGFPNLRRVQNGPAVAYLTFLNSLAPADRERFGFAIQKRFHRFALAALGEAISEADQGCIAEYVAASKVIRMGLPPARAGSKRVDRRLLQRVLKD